MFELQGIVTVVSSPSESELSCGTCPLNFTDE